MLLHQYLDAPPYLSPHLYDKVSNHLPDGLESLIRTDNARLMHQPFMATTNQGNDKQQEFIGVQVD